MFNVIRINGIITVFTLNEELICNVAYENIDKYTLIYCFNMSNKCVKDLYFYLNTLYSSVYLSPLTFHNAYKKQYYFDESDLNIINTKVNEGKEILDSYKMFKNKYFIFLEMNKGRNKIRELIPFYDLEEIKSILINDYSLKHVIPFFYSIREMKEFISENKIKVKDLTILYLLENKTLEGKKR